MKIYTKLIALLFVLNQIIGIALVFPSAVHAQTNTGWTDPVNLSNSGSSGNPWMVVDAEGTIHVFWFDSIDGYKYTNSVDGITWSTPTIVNVPFPDTPPDNFRPVFIAGTNGSIHILWLDKDGVLQYKRSSSSSLGKPSTWTGATKLTDSAVRFDADVDAQGALHVGYISNLDSDSAPAGIYYRRLDGATWSAPAVIYPSKYFRSLAAGDDANVQVATSGANDKVNVYIAWDDRSQRRIFLAKSLDGGKVWEGAFQVRGPEDFTGVETPFNINLGTVGDQLLLLWQAGFPGGQCVQYSQWSVNGKDEFSQPVKLSSNLSQCPQSSEFTASSDNVSVVSLQMPDALALIAWNGTAWSDLQPQNDVSTFVNPATLNTVTLGCRNLAYYNKKIFLVGCDGGNGGDIWFTSRSLGSVDDWFPPPSAWTRPDVLTSTDQKIPPVSSVPDANGSLHTFWTMPPAPDKAGDKNTVQYSRWDGKKWADPATILPGLNDEPVDLTSAVDGQGRVFLSWVDRKTGELMFTWAGADRANRASEWENPRFIPTKAQLNSSPDLLVDGSGLMLVAYAVPINEQRGIYFTESNDAGATWSQPFKIFDAASAEWDVVDQPKVCLSGDGRLHALFTKYSLLGDERQSQGLYYTQSADGGTTWSEPEPVSEHTILWSDIVCTGQQNVHRLWQEENESYFANLDQVSSDGGTTWGDQQSITSLSETPVPGTLTSSADGQLFFIQVVENENPVLQEWGWDGSAWKLLDSKELLLKGKNTPLAVTAGITTKGSLGVLISTLNEDSAGKQTNEIINLSRSVDLTKNDQPSTPAILPIPVAVPTQGESLVATSSPVETPSFDSLDGSSSPKISKNTLGLLLVGGVVVLLVIIFLPWRKKSSRGEKTSR